MNKKIEIIAPSFYANLTAKHKKNVENVLKKYCDI